MGSARPENLHQCTRGQCGVPAGPLLGSQAVPFLCQGARDEAVTVSCMGSCVQPMWRPESFFGMLPLGLRSTVGSRSRRQRRRRSSGRTGDSPLSWRQRPGGPGKPRLQRLLSSRRAVQTAGGGTSAAEDDQEPLYAVGALQDPEPGNLHATRAFKTLVSRSGESLRFLVDSGTKCNVLSLSDYARVTGDHSRRHLQSGVSAIRMYDGSLVRTLGRVNLRLINESSGRPVVLKCRIVNSDVMPILGLQSSVDLGLLEVKNVDPLDYVPKVLDANDTVGGVIMAKADVLTEFEQMVDTATPGWVVQGHTIVTDPQVAPMAEPPRRVRVHVRDRLKCKLDELTAQKVGRQNDHPTPSQFREGFRKTALNSAMAL